MVCEKHYVYPDELEKCLENIREDKLREFVKDIIGNIANSRRLGWILRKYGQILDKHYQYEDGSRTKQYLVKVNNYLVYILYENSSSLIYLNIEIATDFGAKDIVGYNIVVMKHKEPLLYEVEFDNDRNKIIFKKYENE